MVVENSQTAGFILAVVFFGLLAGLQIWRRVKYPEKANGKADPIAEAEVYVAYGRKDRAIEVLKNARLASPNRSDIAAKLKELET